MCSGEMDRPCGCGFVATKTRISKTGDHNRALYISTRTTTSSVWLIAIIMVGTLGHILSQTDAAALNVLMNGKPPRNLGCRRRLIKPINETSRDCSEGRLKDLFGENVPWQNPCSSNAYNDTGNVGAKSFNLAPLKRHLRSMLLEKYGSCNNSDKTNWCHKSDEYKFFEHSRSTDKLCLSLEHKRLQVYVAGLSYLLKLSEDDSLPRIVQSATNLLCELETTINQTACAKPPRPLPVRQMCRQLNLKSLTLKDQTQVDIIFAKANFGRYLRKLNKTLSNHDELPAKTCGRPARTTIDMVSVTTVAVIPNKTNRRQHQPNRGKNRRRTAARPIRKNRNRGHKQQRLAENN